MAVWAKATKSVGIADPMAACAVWDGSVVDRLVGSNDMCHSRVWLHAWRSSHLCWDCIL